MQPIQISRPQFPPGYVEHPSSEVSWEYVAAQLSGAKNYWLCSVRSDGHPHCVPRWGVYLDGKFYYDGSPETRHARNILENPHVSLHLESGSRAIILEGTSQPAGKPCAELAGRLSAAYKAKYSADGYAPEPDQWDQEGLYIFTPRQCLACRLVPRVYGALAPACSRHERWTVFNEDPTKFIFENEG